MRTLAGLLLLLLLAVPAPAQDTTATDTVPDAPSLKEIRQRTGYALDRADNLQGEIAAAIEHLERLRAMTDSAVVRDSMLGDPTPAETVTVTDTVQVAPDSVPPAEAPGRPITLQGDSATAIVSWGAADGARWYNWSSSAGAGFTTDTTARIPVNIGGWVCLWANNAAGQNPAGNGTCTTVDSVLYADSLSLYPENIELEVGETVQLTAAIYAGDSVIACSGSCDTIPGLGEEQVLAWSELGTTTVTGQRRRERLHPNIRISQFTIIEGFP